MTGHTGFKGAWLCLWLKRLGAEIMGYSLEPPTTPNLFNDAGISGLLSRHIIADIRDHALLKKEMLSFKPDLIFHLAAQSLVCPSYDDPVNTIDINLMGTVNILNSLRTLSHPCAVVIVTTDKCYENFEDGSSFSENAPLGGHDPYSASKAMAEIATSSFRRSFFPPKNISDHGIKIATVRAGNVIGGGDWAEDRIVPDLARACQSTSPVFLRNPAHIRPWQHILEPLSGYIMLAEKLTGPEPAEYCSAWNFGPAPDMPPKSVKDLASVFIEQMGKTVNIKENAIANIKKEANILLLDIAKARQKLRWRPIWDFEKTVTKTAQWYKKYFDKSADIREACMEDIIEYETEMSK